MMLKGQTIGRLLWNYLRIMGKFERSSINQLFRATPMLNQPKTSQNSRMSQNEAGWNRKYMTSHVAPSRPTKPTVINPLLLIKREFQHASGRY